MNKSRYERRINFLTGILLLIIVSCNNGEDYKIDDYYILSKSNNPKDIVKIVGVQKDTILVFTSFLNDGKLVLAEDYQKISRDSIVKYYSKVARPKYDGTFSPSKYLDKK